MKIKIILLLFVVFFKNTAFSQSKIIQLHPVLGDSIDLVEKRDYLLFPEIQDSTYIYGLLKMKDSLFRFVSYHKSDSISMIVNQKMITEYQRNIAKLHAYYKNQLEPDSLNVLNKGLLISKTALNQKPANQVKLSKEGKKSIGDEANRLIRLKIEANKRRIIGEKKREFITNGSGGMELFSIKTKKKKEKEKLF